MSLSSVLTTLVAVLGLANLVLALRLTNRHAEAGHERAADGANAVTTPPPSPIGDSGTVAPERRA